jgi:hypothetical protein
MNTVWKILTLPCEEASRLISDGLDRELTMVERFALRAHLISCGRCKRFRRHLTTIELAAKEASEPMPADARERLKNRIEQQD